MTAQIIPFVLNTSVDLLRASRAFADGSILVITQKAPLEWHLDDYSADGDRVQHIFTGLHARTECMKHYEQIGNIKYDHSKD